MKVVNKVIEVFTGGLFIFSGLVKLNDPVGTAIKLEEYFVVFADDFASFFTAFVPLALPLAVFLCVLEVVLGVALLTGFKKRLTVGALLAVIVFFSFLTFYSAYFNKVTDCGCFGDAIPLTPWQSFGKDMVLLALILVLAAQWKKLGNSASGFSKLAVGGSTVACLLVAAWVLVYLPVIDFRDYKVGNSISQLMQPAEACEYEYVMEKDGQEFVFTNYPAQEEGYTFKDTRIKNEKACMPKIVDYSITSNDGEDFTRESLTGKKLFIVVQDIAHTDPDSYPGINQLVGGLREQNPEVTPLILTSESGYFDAFRHEMQLAVPWFYADATVLKAMVRANPGVLLLDNGTVLGKWPDSQIPDLQEVRQLLQEGNPVTWR